jgi:hypothetical protein
MKKSRTEKSRVNANTGMAKLYSIIPSHSQKLPAPDTSKESVIAKPPQPPSSRLPILRPDDPVEESKSLKSNPSEAKRVNNSKSLKFPDKLKKSAKVSSHKQGKKPNRNATAKILPL